MARLLRGVARTAVVAGTATAVSGRVQRRQAARFSESDAQLAAQRQQAYDEQMHQRQQQAPPPPPPPPAPPAAGGGIGNDVIEQLKALAALKEQGILTEEEFAGQKAKVLGM